MDKIEFLELLKKLYRVVELIHLFSWFISLMG